MLSFDVRKGVLALKNALKAKLFFPTGKIKLPNWKKTFSQLGNF